MVEQHWCVEDQFKHFTGVIYTGGVRLHAEKNGAYWLIDAVASYQGEPAIRRNPRLREFQLWELVVDNKSALLTCREDSGMDPVITQRIEYTDHPNGLTRLYVEGNVILLPEEH